MANIVVKKGDSLKLSVRYKQSDGTAVDLNGYTLIIRAKEVGKPIELFNINSSAITNPQTNSLVTFTNKTLGQFNVIIKNTDTFKLGSYIVDIQYIDDEGIKQTSKAFGLKIVDKL